MKSDPPGWRSLNIEAIKYDLDSRATQTQERPSNIWKLQTRLLVKEIAPHQQTRICLTCLTQRQTLTLTLPVSYWRSSRRTICWENSRSTDLDKRTQFRNMERSLWVKSPCGCGSGKVREHRKRNVRRWKLVPEVQQTKRAYCGCSELHNVRNSDIAI
jgi:hypothetical protein